MHLSSIIRVLQRNCTHIPLVFIMVLDSELSTVTHFIRFSFEHSAETVSRALAVGTLW